jgi:uncharacterized protein (DUF2141 family)
VTIPLICNQHPWMKAVAHVISNPYFAVSDAEGAFEIKGLPAGTYAITAIHEKYGSSSQTVTVAAGKAMAPLTFTFSAGTALHSARSNCCLPCWSGMMAGQTDEIRR